MNATQTQRPVEASQTTVTGARPRVHTSVYNAGDILFLSTVGQPTVTKTRNPNPKQEG